MTVAAYLTKARRVAASAHALMASGDPEGAINRAYYAIFDAARALLYFDDPKQAIAKTHSTVARRFGRVTISRGLDRSLGRSLRLAEQSRLVADYEDGITEVAEAQVVVEDMERMRAIIEALLTGPIS